MSSEPVWAVSALRNAGLNAPCTPGCMCVTRQQILGLQRPSPLSASHERGSDAVACPRSNQTSGLNWDQSRRSNPDSKRKIFTPKTGSTARKQHRYASTLSCICCCRVQVSLPTIPSSWCTDSHPQPTWEQSYLVTSSLRTPPLGSLVHQDDDGKPTNL